MRPAHYQSLEHDRVEALFGAWARSAGHPLKVLDFGCGHGKYLRAFAGLGLEAAGVDLNADYRREAKEAGFEAWSPEELFAEPGRRFDIVFLSHLIEHLQPDELTTLIPQLCSLLAPEGRLVIITPLLGERFFHDLSHIRPYYPQSIRHAFGQTAGELSFGATKMLVLVDIYFFRDPYRTRTWRSFYMSTGPLGMFTRLLNKLFDALWRGTGGRIGAKTSWLGVYELL